MIVIQEAIKKYAITNNTTVVNITFFLIVQIVANCGQREGIGDVAASCSSAWLPMPIKDKELIDYSKAH